MGTTRRLYWFIAILGPLLLVLVGGGQHVAAGPEEQTHENEPSQHTERPLPVMGGKWHEVLAGENLRLIAEHYYGSSHKWRLLQLSNDVGMYPQHGTSLWIPAGADAWFAEHDMEATLLSGAAIDPRSSLRP